MTAAGDRTPGPITEANKKSQQGEPFSETKKRLEARTGYKGKSFEKIKFALVRRMPYSKPQYLDDGMFYLSCMCAVTLPIPC